MTTQIARALLIGSLVAVPVAGFAATQATKPAPTKPAATKPATTKAPATHATQGVVKSIDATSLVITRAGKKDDMTFAVNASTHREGTIEAGTNVSVRYTQEGTTNTATAITAKPMKKAPAKTVKK